MVRWRFFLLLIVAACYKVPDSLLQEIPRDLALSSSIQQALASPEFQAGPWPDANWWEWFEDPQLSALIEEGLKNSPDLKAAEARLQVSLDIAKEIRAKLFPHIEFFGSENYQHLSAHGYVRQFGFNPSAISGVPGLEGLNLNNLALPVPAILNVLDLGLRMDWDLDLFGKQKHRWQASLDEARGVAAQASQTRLVLSSQIAQCYFTLQTHQAILETYQTIVEIRKGLQTLVQRREQVGLDSRFESLGSQIDLSAMEKMVYDLEESVELDRHRLFVLIGQNPDLDRELTFQFIPLSKRLTIPDEISSNLLARRPDLMTSIWQVEQAGAQIAVAKGEFFPEINLKGLLSLRSVFPDVFFNLSSAENSLLPSFATPLFRGGELKAKLKEKYSHFEEAVQNYHQQLLKALQEIADLLKESESTRQQLDTQNAIIGATEDQKKLTERQFQVGTADSIAFQQSDLTVLNQKISLINLQSDQILFAIKLIQSLGGGYTSPIEIPGKFICQP